MDRFVDLRSDTVTRPSEEMRRAMATAEVGDDGYGEDPTVRALEEEAATLLGKEAAVFVCSGTMANQIALRLLGRPGTAVVAGRRSHVAAYEHAGAARNAGVQIRELDDQEGVLDPAEVEEAVQGAYHHQPPVSAVFVEDTHMASGGRPWPLERLLELAKAAQGLPIHMDGARIFNSQIATGVPASARAAVATTAMFCLSKGLGAPVGSVLAGPREVMAQAREERFILGGGMRQAGVLAAAGLVALASVEHLAEDHRRASILADAIEERWPGALVTRPVTNIVVFRHPNAPLLLEHLRSWGVLAGTIAPAVVRLVTHLDVDDSALRLAREALLKAP